MDSHVLVCVPIHSLGAQMLVQHPQNLQFLSPVTLQCHVPFAKAFPLATQYDIQPESGVQNGMHGQYQFSIFPRCDYMHNFL